MAMRNFAKNMAAIEKRRKSRVEKDFTRLIFKIGGEAVRRAPIKEGTLRSLMFANTIKSPSGLAGYIYFLVPYAEEQHENETYKHPLGGEAKYLEKAVNNNQDGLYKIVGKLD